MYAIYINRMEKPVAYYNEGANAEVRIPLPTDCSTTASCDDYPLPAPVYENWEMIYRFPMPPCDLHIEVRSENNMMCRPDFASNPMAQAFGTLTGLSGGETSESRPGKRPKFCPECGSSLDGTQKYCRECGKKVELF